MVDISKNKILKHVPINNVWITKESKNNKKEKWSDEIFVSGNNRGLLNELVSSVKSANEIVCVSSFIIQSTEFTDALLEASNRGVRVYLLTASETHLKKEYSDLSEYSKNIVDEHKDLLDTLSDNILVRTGDHLHSKFILVDPNDSNAEGYLLTCNLTEKAMTENIEVLIKLNINQINDLFSQFLRGFWLEAKQELMKKELRPVGDSPFTLDDIPKAKSIHWTIGKENRLRESVIKWIKTAEKDLKISSWGFEKDHDVMKLLETKIQNGVNITILTRISEFNSESLRNLLAAGASIYGHERMHAKTIITDDKTGLIMTSNFSSKGLDEGYETGIITNEQQTKILADIFSYWKDYTNWKYTNTISSDELTNKIIITSPEYGFRKVIDSTNIDIGTFTLKSENEEPKSFPWPKENENIYKSVKFSWIASIEDENKIK